MNVHDCIRCKNPINYDDTDWCDVCDMSIFDDRMVEYKKMLTIKNYKKIKDNQFNCMGTVWLVGEIRESDDYYQFAFLPETKGVFAIHKAQFIRLYRQLNENGVEYDIELTDSNGVRKKIHNQYIKDPKQLINWISSKFLLYVED